MTKAMSGRGRRALWRRREVLGWVTALVLAFACVPAAGAQAAPSWLAPVNISGAERNGFYPDMAIDEVGNVLAVWVGAGGGGRVVQAAARPAGGGWGAPRALSLPSLNAIDPRVALDDEGNAVAVWARLDENGNMVIQAATGSAGGVWSSPEDLSSPGRNAAQAEMALDARGNSVAVWTRFDGSNPVVQAAIRPAGGAWSPPQNLSAEGQDGLAPAVAVDAAGNAVAAWSRGGTVQAARRPLRGGQVTNDWTPAQDISGTGAQDPQVAVDPLGNAVAVWLSSPEDDITNVTGQRTMVQTADRPHDGGSSNDGWSDPQELFSVPEQHAYEPQVAVDAHGAATAAWTRGTAPPLQSDFVSNVQVATRPAGGAWSAPQDVSDLQGKAEALRLAVGANGAAAAVWRRFEGGSGSLSPAGGRYVVVAATRPEAGAWREQDISDFFPQASPPSTEVAVDAQGNAVTGWAPSGFTGPILAAGFDAAGPQLRNLVVPASGTVGERLSFSVAPVDVWSGVAPGSPSWSFGDGAAAAGDSVTHAYARTGAHSVRVTATDSRGNASSSAERTVAVSLAAAGPRAGAGDGGGSPLAAGVRRRAGGAGRLPGGERRRASALRRCLARARDDHSRTRRRVLRRRCLARYGHTPGRVKGLRARAISRTRIALSFRAAGSGRNRGTPARSYLIKQSTRPIRGRRGFRRARSLCRGRCRVRVSRTGERVRFTITGLRPRTTYHYAVAARDNASGRLGPRSRAVRARTR